MRTFALTAVLLALAGFTRADDADPEPPGPGRAALRQLKGTWVSVRRLDRGKEKAFTGMATYFFDGDRAMYSFGGRPPIPLKFELDGKRPNAFRVTTAGVKAPRMSNRYFFKFEKGELHLALDRTGKPGAQADFSGKSMSVVIYQRRQAGR